MLSEFEPETIDWCSYKFLLNAFFQLLEINRADSKIELLRKLGGGRIRDALSENGLSAEGEHIPEEEIFNILEETFYQPNRIQKRRLEFNCQKQRDEESGADFLTRLDDLAKECHFHQVPERVCDQFIAGVRSEELKKRLMIEPPDRLSRPVLLEITSLWESTPEDFNFDFSQLEYAVQQLTSDPAKLPAAKTKRGLKIRALLTPKRSVPRDADISGETLEVETIGPDCDRTLELEASSTRTLRKRPAPVSTAAKTERRTKRMPKESHENIRKENSIQAAGAPVSAKESAAGETKEVGVPKKKGRPPKTAYIPGGKRYKCNHCDYMSDIRRSVLRHERIHTGDRPYKCQFCELRFREKHHLQNHERVHTGETPYICDYCGRGFSKSSTLTDHVRTHTREAPHLCEFCGRGFIQKSALNTHKLIHTGYRPHSCTLCCRGFTTSNLLKSHMKTHAPEYRGRNVSTATVPSTSFPDLVEEPYPVSLSAANFPRIHPNDGVKHAHAPGDSTLAPTIAFRQQRHQDDGVLAIDAPQSSNLHNPHLQKQAVESAASTLRSAW